MLRKKVAVIEEDYDVSQMTRIITDIFSASACLYVETCCVLLRKELKGSLKVLFSPAALFRTEVLATAAAAALLAFFAKTLGSFGEVVFFFHIGETFA